VHRWRKSNDVANRYFLGKFRDALGRADTVLGVMTMSAPTIASAAHADRPHLPSATTNF
jgi:hypothetical protein